MSTLAPPSRALLDRPATLRAWLDQVEELFRDVRAWAEGNGWRVTEEPVSVRKEVLGEYRAPRLAVQAPGALIYVEPVGREIIGAEGRVDLYSYPALTRIMLLRRRDR